MTASEWLACGEPDLLLEEIMGAVSRRQLVAFVSQCWERVAHSVPAVPSGETVVEEFARRADEFNDHDAVVYAAEAALKAAGLAPNLKAEQRQQAHLLRRIVGHSFRPARAE